MKKVIVISSLVLALSSCTVQREVKVVEVPPTTTIAPDTYEPNTQSMDDLYISVIADSYPSVVNQYGKVWLVDFGYNICNAIDNGMTLQELAVMAVQANVQPEMLGFIAGAAIQAFCPRNEWFIKGAMGA